MDQVPGAAAPAADTSVATDATPAPDTTAVPGSEAPQGGEQPEAKPERTFTQKELDEIVQKAKVKAGRTAERIATERARRELAERELERVRAERTGTEKPKSEAPKGRPQMQDFQARGLTPEDWAEALADWKIEQREAEREKKSRTDSESREAVEYAKATMKAISKGSEKFEDFEEVALAEDLPVTRAMAAAMKECDIPADVLYHLGSNRAEAERIAALPSTKQAKAIHDLAETLSKPAAPTRTPAPITPSGTQGVIAKDSSKMSTAEWMAQREADLAKKNARR